MAHIADKHRHPCLMALWLGVDVGGNRKGFDVALIDQHRVVLLEGGFRRERVMIIVASARPDLAAIDSPRCCAPDGQTSRDGERELAKAICGIRWTPDETRVRANDYYAWIVEGLALFEALHATDVDVIEVVPTASLTRWHGKRRGRSRATWSRKGLAAIGLQDVPKLMNQDQRDAIAAAVTARQHTLGTTEIMGDIVVPVDH